MLCGPKHKNPSQYLQEKLRETGPLPSDGDTRPKKKTATTGGDSARSGKKKAELNIEFFRNLGRLLKICIPSWRSKEAKLLLSHSVFLVLRTLISLYVAELDGRLVSALVRGKGKEFLKNTA